MKSDSPSLTAKVIAASTIPLYYSGGHQLVTKKAAPFGAAEYPLSTQSLLSAGN